MPRRPRFFLLIGLILVLAPLVTHAQDDEIPPLTQNHTRAADQTSFSAPEDWLIEETDNFTLLTAPNGVTVGISSEQISDMDDLVLDTIAFISDNLIQQLPGVELNEVEEFEVNSRRAARVTGTDPSGTYFGFWALDLSGEVVGHISVIGPPEDAQEIDLILFAIAETITSGQLANPSPVSEALPLTQTASSGDGAFAVDYPEGWIELPTGDLIILTNIDTSLGSDFSSLEDGEFVVIVQGNSPTELGLDLPEIADPMTIARAIASAAEEDGNPQTIEKLTVNDRAAALAYGAEDHLDRFFLIFAFPDGSLATLLALTPHGELEGLRPTLLAIASSLTSR